MSAACAGFVYELVVGASMVQAGYDHVLIVGGETLSRIIDPEDRATAILFGDGAGAAVLGRGPRRRPGSSRGISAATVRAAAAACRRAIPAGACRAT